MFKPENLNERAQSDRLFFKHFKISFFVPILVCLLVILNHFLQLNIDFIMLPLVCGWFAYVVHRYLSAVRFHLSGVVEMPIFLTGALVFIALVLAAGYFMYVEFPGIG